MSAGRRSSAKGDDLARAFAELEGDEPGFEIFSRRQLALDGVPPTLRELGAELRISHERVRQREAQERAAIATRMEDSGWPVRLAAEKIRAELGSLARPKELFDLLERLDPSGRVLGGAPHRRALLIHLARYRAAEFWIQGTGLDRQTDEMLQTLTAGGPIGLEEANKELGGLGVREALRQPWIESRHGFRVAGELVARRSQTMETAAAVLRAAGEPLDLEELLSGAGAEVSPATFRSRIQHDSRFLRRGVRQYGLSEWGGEPYTTIAGKMIEEIERNGGAIGLDALTESMVERFGVAEGSVRDRARASQFAVDGNGQISCRVGALVVPAAPLALTHGCFRLERGWALKLKVDDHVLHGAASRMPFAFARALGLRLGVAQDFESPYGKIHAYWPRYAISSANLGSVRVAARQLGAGEGDRLFVIRCSEDWLDLYLVTRQRLDSATGMERLALECGIDPGREPQRQVLSALGLDPGLANADEQIRLRLGARHERRLTPGRVSASR